MILLQSYDIVFALALVIFFVSAAFFIVPFFITPSGGQAPLPVTSITVGPTVYEVEIANSILSRTRGLSGRPQLMTGAGMLFIFPVASVYGFWMKDMRFPIDIVWISNNRVVGISHDVPPAGTDSFDLPRYYPPQPVSVVLELPAGTAVRDGIVVDTPVSIGAY
ncbi:MAG: hypothetical protein RIQ54_370 [Candidatus Parcubacteria bacterium]|jgi:uncharacterized membrane protein (UPF0127 family)